VKNGFVTYNFIVTRIRKLWTIDMSIQQSNEVVVIDNVPLSTLSTKETTTKKRRVEESKEMQVKKKAKFEQRPSDCAKSIGKPIKFTGKGQNKKCHYETFEFHGKQYRLVSFDLF